jgi:TRAP-type C4-dicarboxylate transport system substrate-binding protein
MKGYWSKLLGIAILLAMVMTLVACGGADENQGAEGGTNGAAGEGASGETVELNLGTFDPPEHVQTKAMEQFAKDVEEATEGRVKITIYSGGALGSPAEVYDNTLTGIMDIGYGLHGYNPGMWDVSAVMHLPLQAGAPAEKLSTIFQSLYEKYPEMQEEYAQFEPLYIFTADPYHIITADKPVRSLEDLKGMKLRSPSNEGNEIIKSWGATPVNMPSPEIYDALQKGVIDGALLPYSAIADFNLYDAMGYVTEGNFNTAGFYVMANKESWSKISPEDQQAIKELAGQRMSQMAGKAFDQRAAEAKQKSIEAGIEIIELDEAELNKFKEASQGVTEAWMKKMEERGVNGAAMVEDIQSMLAE